MGDVVMWRGDTRNDIPADRVLEAALEAGMDSVVVLGYDKEGEEYFATSLGSKPRILWLLERFKQELLNPNLDGMEE